jgi:hypothetical protein
MVLHPYAVITRAVWFVHILVSAWRVVCVIRIASCGSSTSTVGAVAAGINSFFLSVCSDSSPLLTEGLYPCNRGVEAPIAAVAMVLGSDKLIRFAHGHMGDKMM